MSSRGGSKLLTGIISFLLGFIFAIIVEVGAIFGVYWFVINKDLDSVMNAIGIHNVDAEGNRKYINTDPDKGGVTNLKELIAGVRGMVYENGEMVILGKSFDDIEQLIPATKMALNFVYNTIGDYIELDREEFESTPMSGLAQVLTNSMLEIKTATLMDKLGLTAFTGEDANQVVKSLLMGAETEYATVSYTNAPVQLDETPGNEGESGDEQPASTFRLPVLYDVYTREGDGPVFREAPVNGNSAYHYNLKDESFLNPLTKEEVDGEFTFTKYYLYYVPCRVTANGIEEAEYSFKEIVISEGTGESEKNYRFSVVKYGEDTDFIAVKPVNGKFVLDYEEIYSTLNPASTGPSDRFTGYSYDENYARNYYFTQKNSGSERYELITYSGKNYFRNNENKIIQLDALTLGDIVNDPFTPLDSVPVTKVIDNDVARKVFGNTSLGALMRGDVDFDKLVNDMEISTFVTDVAPDNKVMAYIVFRITDIEKNADGTYTAIYDKYGANIPVNVVVEDGWIDHVHDVNSPDLAMPGVKVNEVAQLTKDMTVNLLMDVNADDAVVTYLGYGITGVKKAEADAVDPLGNPYTHSGKLKLNDGIEREVTCYISTTVDGEGTDARHLITSVWYIAGDEGSYVKTEVKGTKVNEVSTRIEKFTDDLTIGDVLNFDENTDNKLLAAIKDTPISGLENKIAKLAVKDIFSPADINNNAILKQLENTPINGLANEIDNLLVQRIYCEEIYGLPSSVTAPMQVVEFNPDFSPVFTVGEREEATGTVKAFIKVDGERITQEQYDNRGRTIYYTNWSADDSDDSMKIIGFDEKYIYFEKDASGNFKPVDRFLDNSMSQVTKDDLTGHLTAEQYAQLVSEGVKLYTFGAPVGMWRLVLFKNGNEKSYTINNFNNMVACCASNVNGATLKELQEAGVISASADLSRNFYGTSTKLEDMSLAQLIDAVIALSYGS